MTVKMGKRLQQIVDMAWRAQEQKHYQHIWDMCCDHGQVGINLLDRSPACHLHFVDQVPSIMTSLQLRLEHHFASSSTHWHTHCQDAGQISFSAAESHLVIIAGVGGVNTLALINQMLSKTPSSNIDFLLCPVHQLWPLRKALNQKGYGLEREQLLQENRRFYELLYVSGTSQKAISNTGCHLWQADKRLSEQYQQRLLAHYHRMQHADDQHIATIIDAYMKVDRHWR
ncbi:tRNA (adenine(22)-N(1))-methyltransferase TrmK [Motilimonas pumila]|uniref:SAM-dependent methyltransferase n=1 Tax=Motilimonas pumila TaxID=2303987 RepID=A0A418YFR6_9GAMM|nr:tRNA (adenine(22)-N(1))-methyltransferase TrmK [Motilimonas pumila]RJG48161.1 SAM-dependent methyltransferase [Motilimonas pumila]